MLVYLYNGATMDLLGGLGAMFGWGFSDFFAKQSVAKLSPVAVLFWVQVLGLIPLFLFTGAHFDLQLRSLDSWGALVAFALTDTVGYLLFYKALKVGKLSLVGPVFASYAAGAVLVTAVFERMVPDLVTSVLLGVMFVGIVLTSIELQSQTKKQKKATTRGVVLAGLGALLFSFWYPMWDLFVSREGGSLDLVFFLRIGVSLLLFAWLVVTRELKLFVSKNRWSMVGLAIAGLGDACAYYALSIGYELGSNPNITTMFGSAYSLPTLFLARFILRERLNRFQYIGVVLLLVGVMLIAVTRKGV